MTIENAVKEVVDGFGEEWSRFDQTELSDTELYRMLDHYFNIFPWEKLAPNAVGFDLGSGSGRWAKFMVPKVGFLHLIDPSAKAQAVACRNLNKSANCDFHVASVDQTPTPYAGSDFGYSLGVLHHIPDTAAGLCACVAKLKPGAPFLLYLYYRFDNRPVWFRAVWQASDAVCRVVAHLPHGLRAS